jgi:hypothetical protein
LCQVINKICYSKKYFFFWHNKCGVVSLNFP